MIAHNNVAKINIASLKNISSGINYKDLYKSYLFHRYKNSLQIFKCIYYSFYKYIFY